MAESTHVQNYAAETPKKARKAGKEAPGGKSLREKAGVADENIVDRMARVINAAAKEGTLYKKMRENEQVIIYMSEDRKHIIKELPGGKVLWKKAEDGAPWEPYDGPLHQGRTELLRGAKRKGAEQKN